MDAAVGRALGENAFDGGPTDREAEKSAWRGVVGLIGD